MIVYLDTNAYMAAHYIFDRDKFAMLLKLLSEDKIKIIYTSATQGEVEKHLEEDIKSQVTKYNRLLRKDMKSFVGDSTYIFNQMNCEEVINCFRERFVNFLNHKNVEIISLNPLDAEILLQDYFNMNPPFESKKPNEFKDAIMINAIKKYQSSVQEKIHIVASDKGFRAAFQNDTNFITYQFLGDFLNHYRNIHDQYLAAVEKCVETAVDHCEFDYDLTSFFTDIDVDRSDYEQWECEAKEVKDIQYNLSFIEEIGNKIYITLGVSLDISMEISFRDEKQSYYDKEDGQYLFEKYVRAIEDHRINTEVRGICSIVKSENDELIVESIEIDFDNSVKILDLDDDTLYKIEEISTNEIVDDNIERCNQCGKIIGRTTDGANFDYEGNALCQKCAVSDAHGEICPSCGRKIPHELMNSGFCVDCFSEID